MKGFIITIPSTQKVLTVAERIDWLRLIRSENVGVRTFNSLLLLYGSATAALEAIPVLALKGGRKKPIKICSKSDAIAEIERCQEMGAVLIASCEPHYPRLLKETKDAPPIITVLGRTELLNQESVAIVGARNASATGCRFAQKLARDLGKREVVVVSGLARGIDTSAHQGALETGTVAVIAGGIDHIYPKENTALFKEIAEKGAIIAELPIGSVPQGKHFPQRNRIISGLSRGTVVVEATFGSGSLITARIALEQNREVFAVPGSPADPRCKGTNDLIRQGAIITEHADDVMSVIHSLQERERNGLLEREVESFMTAANVVPGEGELDKARPLVIEKLGATPILVDDLLAETGLTPNILLTILLELELAGRLERHFGNRVSLVFEEELLVA